MNPQLQENPFRAHSPGPWTAERVAPGAWMVNSRHWPIAALATEAEDSYARQATEADARLIAAAPELLQIAIILGRELDMQDREDHATGELRYRGPDGAVHLWPRADLHARIRAALARALAPLAGDLP